MAIRPDELTYIADIVYKRAAIVIDSAKAYLVESRLTPLAKEQGLEGVSELILKMKTPQGLTLHAKVVEAMTTNETLFFRDVHPFEAMKKEIIPNLIKARAATRALSIWSAACSTGQEAYSTVMMLRTEFPELATWRIRIIGTDISPNVVEKAKLGLYRQLEVNRGLPAPLLIRFFDRAGADWQLKQEVRSAVEFRVLNLIEPWGTLPVFDIVLLRNVLIYFDVETKKRILGRMRAVLAPDGALFLGGAESTLNLDDAFERVPCGPTSYYRIREGKR